MYRIEWNEWNGTDKLRNFGIFDKQNTRVGNGSFNHEIDQVACFSHGDENQMEPVILHTLENGPIKTTQILESIIIQLWTREMDYMQHLLNDPEYKRMKNIFEDFKRNYEVIWTSEEDLFGKLYRFDIVQRGHRVVMTGSVDSVSREIHYFDTCDVLGEDTKWIHNYPTKEQDETIDLDDMVLDGYVEMVWTAHDNASDVICPDGYHHRTSQPQ